MRVLRSLAFVFVYLLIFYNAHHFVPDSTWTWVSSDLYPIVVYALIILWIFLITDKQNLNIGKGFYINHFHPVNIAAVFLVTTGLWLAAFAVTHTQLLSQYAQSYRDAVSGIFDGSFTLALVTVCIIAPAFEEIMFRGIILGEMTPVMPFHIANIIQALLFAVVHGNIIQGIYTFIVGLCLGISYRRSGNIYMPIAIHILFNTANALIYRFNISFPYSDIVFAVIALLLLWSGLYIIKGGRRKA